MCEQRGVSQKPATMELSRLAGISKSYASEILNDDPNRSRPPSRALAIHIFRTTGWKHPSIAELTEQQMKVLEQVDPWVRAA